MVTGRDYLKQLHECRSRTWTSSTGTGEHTYEEALALEHKAKEAEAKVRALPSPQS